ncbi:MAG: tetratricopeptide repeat protein [Gammaproteobacteria bacterium]|nr:tetratricopeptide repeat protein [Gammaproteobacteria bacterium]
MSSHAFRCPWALLLLSLSPVLPALQPSDRNEAESALLAGDCKRAVDGYLASGLVDRDPRTIERALEVARACRNLPAAAQAADRLFELDGENVEALRLIGLVALETWRLDFARKVYRDLLVKPDVEVDRALADLLPEIAEGDATAAAWLVFRDLVDREKASAGTLSTLARIACNADDLSACRELIAAARAKGGGNEARTIQLLAAAAAAQGDDRVALAEADLIAQGDPENHRFARIETLIALDRLDQAREELLAIESNREAGNERTVADADRRLALLALSMGDEAEAERRFEARLSRDRSAAEALFYLAVIAERRGRKDVALQSYRQLATAGAGLPPRIRAARLLLERNDRSEALKFFDEMLRSGRSDTIEVEIARSRTLQDAGLTDEALATLDPALARFPSHPELLYQRAVVLDAGGRTSEGIKAFEDLLALRPDDSNIQNALGYTLADRKRQLPRAEKLIRAAVAQRPDNAAFIDSLGWVLYRRGDKQAALPLLERAWRLSREAEIGAHWGEVLWKMGDKAAARAIWARALSITPESKPLRGTLERLAGEGRKVGKR